MHCASIKRKSWILSFSVFFPLCFQWLGLFAPNDFTALGRLLNTFQNFDGPFGWHTSHNKAKYCGESEHREENGSVLEQRRQQALNLSHPIKDKEGGLGSCPLSTFQIMCLFTVLQGSNNWNVINWVNEKKSCIFFHQGQVLLIEAVRHICVKQPKVLSVRHPAAYHVSFLWSKMFFGGGSLNCISLSAYLWFWMNNVGMQ